MSALEIVYFTVRGTSDMWNSRWREKSAYLPPLPFQMLLLPMDTSPQGYEHAAGGREISHGLVYWLVY